MDSKPYTFDIKLPGGIPDHYDNHIERRLSSMRGQFLDQKAYSERLAREDTLLYEVYEFKRPEIAGELLHGISIVHPGKVGNEYYMTKGHFHTVLETAEVYYCLQGQGYMVMETPEGEWSVEPLRPGSVLYVPPRWAHRSVNTALDGDLVTFFIYPGDAGHDYGTIESQGYRKLVMDTPAGASIVDNPRWKSPEERHA
ncbi:glucose-6-phosphate isomerase [Longilinea arvoryzae]|uniref:glucose-6-phosphate isomerase n=1 Tax=Longilinea arvoryzae TaxID=360412 RepID=A0A0S7B7Q2_9CHLR|nr:glucose-6-phosphate isomerase [Longilinea arvoryzae]GAP13150.1 glucose-6-phosphate isomerase [Longilinea arvoryzae]